MGVLYHNLPSPWKHTDQRYYFSCITWVLMSAPLKVPTYQITSSTQNATLFDAAFIKLFFFLSRNYKIQLTIIISNTTGSDQPNSLFPIIHFMVTLSTLSKGKARPKHEKQQSCLCGNTPILFQESECDLKKSHIFYDTKCHNEYFILLLVKAHTTHNVTMLSQVNSSWVLCEPSISTRSLTLTVAE